MIKGEDFDKFSTLDEFSEAISAGLDIEFYLRKIRYNISWENHKPYISICPQGDTAYYENTDDLLTNHKIDGMPIGALWRDIEVVFM